MSRLKEIEQRIRNLFEPREDLQYVQSSDIYPGRREIDIRGFTIRLKRNPNIEFRNLASYISYDSFPHREYYFTRIAIRGTDAKKQIFLTFENTISDYKRSCSANGETVAVIGSLILELVNKPLESKEDFYGLFRDIIDENGYLKYETDSDGAYWKDLEPELTYKDGLFVIWGNVMQTFLGFYETRGEISVGDQIAGEVGRDWYKNLGTFRRGQELAKTLSPIPTGRNFFPLGAHVSLDGRTVRVDIGTDDYLLKRDDFSLTRISVNSVDKAFFDRYRSDFIKGRGEIPLFKGNSLRKKVLEFYPDKAKSDVILIDRQTLEIFQSLLGHEQKGNRWVEREKSPLPRTEPHLISQITLL